MRRLLPALVLALALGATAVPAAHANAFEDIFAVYQKNGSIDPCRFSADELRRAKRQVPNDIEQYAPDFPAALDAAAEARATGACKKKPGSDSSGGEDAAAGATGGTPSAGTPVPAPDASPAPAPEGSAPAAAAPSSTPTPQPTPDPQPAPAAADQAIGAAAASARVDEGADAPAPLLLLAIVGGLLALAAALVGAARWWAFEPAWLVRWRHSTSEAGWRASNAWAEFTDWVRLGR